MKLSALQQLAQIAGHSQNSQLQNPSSWLPANEIITILGYCAMKGFKQDTDM
jgi:hypothetical protein